MGKVLDVVNIEESFYVNNFCRMTNVEKNVDRAMGKILEDDFGLDAVFQDKVEPNKVISKEYADKINSIFPSKGSTDRNGKPDYIVITNRRDSMVEILADNKSSQISIDKGLNDAIYYANHAIAKGIDVRIALASNGVTSVFRVFDREAQEWIPFTVDGLELKGVPTKALVDLIYNDNAIGIKTDFSRKQKSSQTIRRVLDELDEIYYGRYNYLSQNKHNEMKIDFTIANVVLQTLLDKYKYIFEKTNNWEDMEILYEVKSYYSNNESRKINKAIILCLEIIFNKNEAYDEYVDIFKQYRDVFVVRDMKNKKKILFDYRVLIQDIGSVDYKDSNKTLTADIYRQFMEIETLHESDIDLFGEIYEKLMNNKTKKDFGQFFTKRNLTTVLAKLLLGEDVKILINEYVSGMNLEFINDNFNKILVDFACGTGGLITEVMHLIKTELKNGNALNKFINEKNLDLSKKNEYVDEILKNMCNRCIYACDIAGENVARTKVNVFFAGDGYRKIDEVDSLHENELNTFLDAKTIDALITNIPMGSKTDALIKVDDKIISNKKISENQFLVQSVKYLKPGVGKAMIIVPDGILEGTENYELREWLVKQCKVTGIVGFPKHSFAPYTHEKTYAIFLEKRSDSLKYLIDSDGELNNELIAENGVYMYIVDNDGFANSDKRFATDLKDENGKWKHNELSEWYDLNGKVHPSLLEECWRRKSSSQDSSVVSIDEWDNVIPGEKYGVITYQDILSTKIITRGTMAKKINLNMKFCQQLGLYIERDYTVDELVKLYNQGTDYVVNAINALGLSVDKERKYQYVPILVPNDIEIKGKKLFQTYLKENEVFGHNQFKITFDFKKSSQIDVVDLKTNTRLYDKSIDAMLKAANIKIEYKDVTPKNAQFYILDNEGNLISEEVLQEINSFIKANYDQYDMEVNIEKVADLLINDEVENLFLEEVSSLGYELESDDSGYKVYHQVEKRIINLLPENYLRPVVTENVSLEVFLERLSEIGILSVEEVKLEKEYFNGLGEDMTSLNNEVI